MYVFLYFRHRSFSFLFYFLLLPFTAACHSFLRPDWLSLILFLLYNHPPWCTNMPLSCSSSEHRSYFGRIKSSFVSHLKRTALKRSSSKASSQKLKRHSNGSEKKMLDWRFLSPEIPPLPPVTEKSPATLKTNPKSHERGSLFEVCIPMYFGKQMRARVRVRE